MRVFGVEEKAVDDGPTVLHAKVSEGDHGCGGGCVGPLGKNDLGWTSRGGLGEEAFGDDIEDASVGEIAVEGRVEGALEGRGLGVARCGFEVGDGDADVGGSSRGLGLEPVLRVQGRRGDEKESQRCEPEFEVLRGVCDGVSNRAENHLFYRRRKQRGIGCP